MNTLKLEQLKEELTDIEQIVNELYRTRHNIVSQIKALVLNECLNEGLLRETEWCIGNCGRTVIRIVSNKLANELIPGITNAIGSQSITLNNQTSLQLANNLILTFDNPKQALTFIQYHNLSVDYSELQNDIDYHNAEIEGKRNLIYCLGD